MSEAILLDILKEQRHTNNLLRDLITAMSEALEPEEPQEEETPPAWLEPNS